MTERAYDRDFLPLLGELPPSVQNFFSTEKINADALGVDPSLIAIAGQSAGADSQRGSPSSRGRDLTGLPPTYASTVTFTPNRNLHARHEI